MASGRWHLDGIWVVSAMTHLIMADGIWVMPVMMHLADIIADIASGNQLMIVRLTTISEPCGVSWQT